MLTLLWTVPAILTISELQPSQLCRQRFLTRTGARQQGQPSTQLCLPGFRGQELENEGRDDLEHFINTRIIRGVCVENMPKSSRPLLCNVPAMCGCMSLQRHTK